jgi:hypothetical protein
VVERILGKAEVVSSILTGSTIALGSPLMVRSSVLRPEASLRPTGSSSPLDDIFAVPGGPGAFDDA